MYFVQSSSSLPTELAPSADSATPQLSESQSLASSASLDHPDPPLPTSSGSFATSLPYPAPQQDHLPFDSGAFEESDNDASDPDPGCLDLDPTAGQDGNAGTQLEDPSLAMLPDLESIFENTCLEDLLTAIAFIRALQSASLDDSHCKMDQNAIQRLRNPPTIPFDISSLPDLRLGLDLFLANMNSSVDSFNANRDAILRRHPMDHVPSYEQMKRHISDITGVGSIVHPMCKNSCLAFTGPFADLDRCPKCNEPKLCPNTKKPQQEFHTILLGPILQALWRDASSAKKFYHRRWKTWEIIRELQTNSGNLSSYDDFYSGSDYLEYVRSGKIQDNDIVLMLSIDGAQLYAHKASDCWIYVWVIMELSPDERYTKWQVHPGGFIPGPNKPKNVDSFLFPGLHHVCALQREGLHIWDAFQNKTFTSQLFLALNTADGPAMAYLNGLVGHHGKFGCRLYCAVPGRHKPNGSHYYPALMKPVNYVMQGCDHEDLPFTLSAGPSSNLYFSNLNFLLKSPNETQYKKRRLETGITKPTIFLGFNPNRILGIPGCFGSDIMHLGTFNLSDLLVPLWRGILDHDIDDLPSSWPWAVLKGEIWETHGRDVAAATPFLPGSFDRPPRNIAEKINSGYKAWEWLLYLYGLAPALLYGVLPEPYYSHFCKLVRAMRIIHQHHIRTDDLQLAGNLLESFVQEFETFYYQRKVGRLHFCRQSIHALLHIAPEVTRIGPPICSSQWTMERTIGNLGEEIRQPSNPYANLSQRGLLRCQVNALKAMIPDLAPPTPSFPRGAIDLGEGYVLLRAKDRYDRLMRPQEAGALLRYLGSTAVEGSSVNWCPKVTRWARLRLPNGQVARSRWKEAHKPLGKLRTARNVKV
jgi:hypothetical protein